MALSFDHLDGQLVPTKNVEPWWTQASQPSLSTLYMLFFATWFSIWIAMFSMGYPPWLLKQSRMAWAFLTDGSTEARFELQSDLHLRKSCTATWLQKGCGKIQWPAPISWNPKNWMIGGSIMFILMFMQHLPLTKTCFLYSHWGSSSQIWSSMFFVATNWIKEIFGKENGFSLEAFRMSGRSLFREKPTQCSLSRSRRHWYQTDPNRATFDFAPGRWKTSPSVPQRFPQGFASHAAGLPSGDIPWIRQTVPSSRSNGASETDHKKPEISTRQQLTSKAVAEATGASYTQWWLCQ